MTLAQGHVSHFEDHSPVASLSFTDRLCRGLQPELLLFSGVLAGRSVHLYVKSMFQVPLLLKGQHTA